MPACRLRWRRCSPISAGPVAQFRPMASMPSGCRAVRAAPISEPSSMVPVVSTVTLTRIGMRRCRSAMAAWLPSTAALACSRSWLVSIRTASTPPSSIPSTCWVYASRSVANGAWPNVGSFVPGPTEPRTYRGWSALDHSRAASAAICAPARASSRIRCSMPYSARFARFAPKVLVSTASTPTSKYASCSERMTSGRVALRTSLQPSCPSKSSSVKSWDCSIVPVAPSAMTTRRDRAVSKSSGMVPPAYAARGDTPVPVVRAKRREP